MVKVRLIDIAQAVGVSKVTVSKVLSQTAGNNTHVGAETTRRILDAARQMGYQPNIAAQQLAGQSSHLIGVLIDSNSIFNEFPRVVYAEQAANARGYRTIVGQCHPDLKDIKTFIDDFSARAVDGVIMHAHAYPGLGQAIMEACSKFQHIVYYDRPDSGAENVSFVDIDLVAGMKKLVAHIANSGRRKIVYFVPYMRFPLGKHRSFRERERGFKEAMAAHGLPFEPNFAERHIFNVEPNTKQVSDCIRELVAKEHPDAIIARNDDIAAIVIKTLLEMGVNCPDDIAVAGYDNRSFAEYLHPGLTTMDNKLALVSNTAVETLIRRIERKGAADQPEQFTTEPELIVREST